MQRETVKQKHLVVGWRRSFSLDPLTQLGGAVILVARLDLARAIGVRYAFLLFVLGVLSGENQGA